MRVFKYWLLNVPFNNSYKNVFTFADKLQIQDYIGNPKQFSTLYAEILIQTYGNGSITGSPTNRAIKTTYNDTVLTIYETKQNVMKYNYIIFSDGNNYKHFYFITDVVSQNDDTTYPSCTISLERDIWSSNIYELSFNKSFNITTSRHYDRFYLDKVESDINTWKMRGNRYPININKGLEHFEETNIPEYRVLTMVLVMNENAVEEKQLRGSCKFYSITYDESHPPLETDLFVQSNIPILPIGTLKFKKNLVYVPIGLYSITDHTFVDFTVRGLSFYRQIANYNPVTKEKMWEAFGSIDVDVKRYDSPPLRSTYIDRAYLTYNAPFNYNVTYGGGKYIVNVNALVFNGKLNDEYNGVPIIGYTSEDEKPFTLSEYKLYENSALIDNETFNIDLSYNELPQDSNSYRTSVGNNHYIDPALLSYPFKYLKFTVNELEIPLVSYGKYTTGQYQFRLNYGTSQAALFTNFIDHDGRLSRIIFEHPYYVSNSGDISYSKSALDDYLIRNGSQAKTAQYLKGLNGIMNALPNIASMNVVGGVTSLIPAIGSIHQYNAVINDMDRAPDTSMINTGENDVLKQDRLIIKTHDMIKDKNYDTYKDGFYLYGYNVVENTDIFTDYRISFDYCKTENCNINLPIPLNDRITIENVFNSGIHKHHILKRNGDFFIMNPEMSFDDGVINNIEYKFLVDEDYIDWLERS